MGIYRKVDKTVKMHINSHWVVSVLFSYSYLPYKRHLRDQKQQNTAGLPVVSFVPNALSVLKWTRSMAGKYESFCSTLPFLQRQRTSRFVCFSLNVHAQGLCQQRKCSLISQTLLCKSQESFVQAQWRSKMFQGIFLTAGMKLVWFTHETNMAEFPRLRVMG